MHTWVWSCSAPPQEYRLLKWLLLYTYCYALLGDDPDADQCYVELKESLLALQWVSALLTFMCWSNIRVGLPITPLGHHILRNYTTGGIVYVSRYY